MPEGVQTKPLVMISSTVSDFADLRSALKFWLEENGCVVSISEANDMDKPMGPGTIESCLEAVRRSDFYILLIGTRKGWTLSDGASVTQLEYRTAYETYATSVTRPLPVLFVRADVKTRVDTWAGSGGDPPSGIDDPQFTRDLIGEVERQDEASAYAKGLGPAPLANFLHRFTTFRDIVDALRVALNLRADISTQRTLAALKLDLEITLGALLARVQPQGTAVEESVRSLLANEKIPADNLDRILNTWEFDFPFSAHLWLKAVVEAHPLGKASRDLVTLNGDEVSAIEGFLLVGRPAPHTFRVNALEQAVASGSLLTYDPEARSLIDSDLSLAVIELIHEIRLYESRLTSIDTDAFKIAADLREQRRSYGSANLSWEDALRLWALQHSLSNLYLRASSIYAFLSDRRPSPRPDGLLPDSPLGEDVDRDNRRRRANPAELRRWVKRPEFGRP